jgi:hypothetical protein
MMKENKFLTLNRNQIISLENLSSHGALPILIDIFQNQSLLKEMATSSGNDRFLRDLA